MDFDALVDILCTANRAEGVSGRRGRIGELSVEVIDVMRVGVAVGSLLVAATLEHRRRLDVVVHRPHRQRSVSVRLVLEPVKDDIVNGRAGFDREGELGRTVEPRPRDAA